MAGGNFDFLDDNRVTNILYHPGRRAEPLQSGREVRIDVGDGVALGGAVYSAGAGAPMILYFHGNGEIASDYDMLSQLYTGMGITLFVVDFRGYGASDGRPAASNQLSDAVKAYDQARDVLGEDGTGPMFLMGRSMGSASALEIAARAGDGIKGLIIESGFARSFELIERLGGLRLPGAVEGEHGFANADKMARVKVPTLVIHGQDDWIIPITDGRQLFEACPAEDKTMVEIPHAGHNDLLMVGQREYFGSIFELVRRCVVGEG